MSTTFEPFESGANALPSAGFARWVDQLAGVDHNAADAELIDQISQLERVKSACAAAQATLTAAFVGSQVEGLPAATVRDERVHRSIAAQVALARKDSPVRGGRHVGLAKVLTREMPNTFSALQTGEISEWRATLLVRETACLSVEHRQQVDAELAGKLSGLGDKGIAQAAAKIAQRLDPGACVKRQRKAVSERRVSIRPAPDTMSYISALLPVAHGVAVYAALLKYADAARAIGDPRSRDQVMADEMVNRVTQPAATAGDAGPSGQDRPTPSSAGPDASGCPDMAGKSAAENPDESTTAASGSGDADLSTPTDTETPDTASIPGDHSSVPDGGRSDTDAAVEVRATGGCFSSPAVGDTGTADIPTADIPTADIPTADIPTADIPTADIPAAVIPAGVNLDIQLVMTDRTLFDGDAEPAHLVGYGPIPAPLARQLIRDAGPKVKAWIRRLYTDPESGHLINGDARRRFFGDAERQFFIARDQFCRSPYCDAPIRQADHVEGHANGPADLTKGQGLCENCNYNKEMPGWTSRVEPGTNRITITTPTGHTHHSDPPPPPRSAPWVEAETPVFEIHSAATPTVESRLAELLRSTLQKHDIPRVDIIYPEIRFGHRFEVA